MSRTLPPKNSGNCPSPSLPSAHFRPVFPAFSQFFTDSRAAKPRPLSACSAYSAVALAFSFRSNVDPRTSNFLPNSLIARLSTPCTTLHVNRISRQECRLFLCKSLISHFSHQFFLHAPAPAQSFRQRIPRWPFSFHSALLHVSVPLWFNNARPDSPADNRAKNPANNLTTQTAPFHFAHSKNPVIPHISLIISPFYVSNAPALSPVFDRRKRPHSAKCTLASRRDTTLDNRALFPL